MKIIVDENIPLMTVAALRKLGHEVLDIRGTPDEGMPDPDLWVKSQNEGRLVITTDKGFSKHRYEHHYGILVIRLKNPNRVKIHQRVMQAMNQFGENEWSDMLVVMRDVVQAVWKSKP
jgi:predicted nuclease of predicted toxin-antitoxin system